MLFVEVCIIFGLILLNGLLAMAELAVVSSRRSRIEGAALKGDRGAARVLALMESPSAFLATVQVGITLVAILAGVFGGASLSQDLGTLFTSIPVFAPLGQPLAYVLVVLLIAYLSVVIGELIPKRLALQHPEAIAKALSAPLMAVASLGRPIVWMLERSTDALLRPFGVGRSPLSAICAEDLKSMVTHAARIGVLVEGEKEIIQRVFRLGDRKVASLMTPRTQVTPLILNSLLHESTELALLSKHTWFPVLREEPSGVIGIISIHALIEQAKTGEKFLRAEECEEPLRVPGSVVALKLLELFKRERKHFAVVLDEYGDLSGVVTVHDVVEALVGDLGEHFGDPPSIVVRVDGTLLVDAAVDINELFQRLGVESPEGSNEGDFHSVGGFVIKQLGHLPKIGEHFEHLNIEFEVVDMDGHRIDKVLVSKIGAGSN